MLRLMRLLAGNFYKLGKMPKRAPDFEKLIYFSEEEAYIVNSLIDNLDQTNNIKVNLKRKLATIYNSTSIAEYIDKKSISANIRTLSEAIKILDSPELEEYHPITFVELNLRSCLNLIVLISYASFSCLCTFNSVTYHRYAPSFQAQIHQKICYNKFRQSNLNSF